MNKEILYIRKFLRDKLLDLLSLNAKPNVGIHILNGHFLSLNNDAPPEIFHKLLERLMDLGVKFINFDEAALKIMNKEYPQNE